MIFKSLTSSDAISINNKGRKLCSKGSYSSNYIRRKKYIENEEKDWIDIDIDNKLRIRGKVKHSKIKPYSLYTNKNGISFYANSELMFRTKLLKFYNVYKKVSFWLKGQSDTDLLDNIIIYYPLTCIEQCHSFSKYTSKDLLTIRNNFLTNKLTPHLDKVFKKNLSSNSNIYVKYASEKYNDVL